MLCHLHRWTINHAHDDQRELPAITRDHLESCAPCQRHHEAQASIAKTLRAEDPALPAPATLAKSIQRHLRHQPPPAPAFSLPAWSMALGSLAIAALIWQFLQPPALPVPAPPLSQPAASSLPTMATVDVEAVTDRMAKSVAQPFNREINLLRRDLEAAAEFLTASVVARP